MLAPVTHHLAVTTIIRRRVLPVDGEVLVKLNQKVSATDIVAEASFSQSHHLIDIARSFNIKAADAEKMTSLRVGEKVEEGTVVATSKGFVPRQLKVKHTGRVVAIGGGQVLIDISKRDLQLKAGVSGEVIEVIPNRGVVLRETGALIQGVWGNGKIDRGRLHVLAEKENEILASSQFDISLRSLVILAGSCQDADSLKAAADITVRGLILSSLHPSLIGLARKMPYPIIVTDALGKQPMNATAFKILSTNNQRDNVSLHGDAFNRHKGTRPEIVIPLPQNSLPPEPLDIEHFKTGQAVRMVRAPHAGAVGTLVDLPAIQQVLSNGLRVTAGVVKFDDGEQITVPLVNLEVLG
jgi:hypothetical protein